MSFVINPYRFGGGAPPGGDIPTGYFAEYLFDTDGSDTSGNGYTATLFLNAAVSGGVLQLDGAGDRATIADTDDFSFTDGAGTDEAFSISAWIRPTQAIGTAEIIATKCGLAFEWEFQTDGSGLLQLVIYNNNASAYIFGRSGSTYVQNTWLHVVVTYDGSEASTGIEVYLDGTNDTTTQDGVGSYTGMTNSGNNVGIGSRAGTAASEFQGDMDNIRFYNRELTLSEVGDLFAEGHS